MKQIEIKKVITYRWWRDGDDEIKPEHAPALEERANDRIAEMMKEGYTSGELVDNIYMTDEDPEDGTAYRGWWEMKESRNIGKERLLPCKAKQKQNIGII